MKKSLLFSAALFLGLCQSLLFAQITSVVPSSSIVAPGGVHYVTVTYTAAADTDILLIFRQIEGDFTWVYQSQLTAPAGTDAEIVFTMGNDQSFNPQPTSDSTDSHIWIATSDNFGVDTMSSAPASIDTSPEALSNSKFDFNSESFSVYPNPVQTTLNIKLPSAGNVEIISLNGKVLMSKNVESVDSLNLDNLSSGLYFLRYTGANVAKTVKLIKQ